ncbi:flagellar basal-body rod protein FlgG [Indioceanicola profundi]|uniref:flagellar basal-body rod protein FlgG n=1 Tax=Indioceanicola profundi TaxID=2220096 RepID=UPI000E6AC9A4|nr:flagellar basal-body rod protein FlgG [Indioceanicola profundi]
MRTLNIAATGMMAQQLNVEVISNNIANLNTVGYKRSRAEFQDLMYQSQLRPGSPSSDQNTIVPAGIQLGLGVKPSAVGRISTQGPLNRTENQYDVALDGKGYLVVTMPDGQSAYTRAGNFQLSPEGTIVTVDGYQVSPGITVPENTREVMINRNGEVLAYLNGQTEPENVGQFEMAMFVNEAGLEAIGYNLFRETPASGIPLLGMPGQLGFAGVRQGYLEAANVNIVQEITNLISAQRAYEMNSRVVEAGDQMLNTVAQMR